MWLFRRADAVCFISRQRRRNLAHRHAPTSRQTALSQARRISFMRTAGGICNLQSHFKAAHRAAASMLAQTGNFFAHSCAAGFFVSFRSHRVLLCRRDGAGARKPQIWLACRSFCGTDCLFSAISVRALPERCLCRLVPRSHLRPSPLMGGRAADAQKKMHLIYKERHLVVRQ